MSHEGARLLATRHGIVLPDRTAIPPPPPTPTPTRPRRMSVRAATRAFLADDAAIEAFRQNVQPGPVAHRGHGPCLLWTGPLTRAGYGLVPYGGARLAAHRLAFRLAWGHPQAATIDHLCHSASTACRGGPTDLHRRCLEPEHLEAVALGENGRRSNARDVWPQCRRGHPWLRDQAVYDGCGRRVCIDCEAGFY